MAESARTYLRAAAFERAVKREARAPRWRVLAVCAPGMETILSRELTNLGFPPEGQSSVPGGVEWTTELAGLWRACLGLGTANRLWLRLAEFRSGATEELFAKTLALPWELWLPQGTPVEVRAIVRYSRLSHEGRAARTVTEAIEKRWSTVQLPGPPTAAPAARQVLLRVEHNRVELSLDASGDLHYRRGYRQAAVPAPIRESLAFGLVTNLMAGLGLAVGKPSLIVDGMSGGGTLGIEAYQALAGLAPGRLRNFACQDWPGLSLATQNHWRAKAQGAAPTLIELALIDKDPAAVEASRRNLAAAALPTTGLVAQADFFTFNPPAPADRQALVCLNPPYGRRLDAATTELYAAIRRRLAAAYQGFHVLVILPSPDLRSFFPAQALSLAFRHGGLRVQALAWREAGT